VLHDQMLVGQLPVAAGVDRRRAHPALLLPGGCCSGISDNPTWMISSTSLVTKAQETIAAMNMALYTPFLVCDRAASRYARAAASSGLPGAEYPYRSARVRAPTNSRSGIDKRSDFFGMYIPDQIAVGVALRGKGAVDGNAAATRSLRRWSEIRCHTFPAAARDRMV
jgi:hypothetical protein